MILVYAVMSGYIFLSSPEYVSSAVDSVISKVFFAGTPNAAKFLQVRMRKEESEFGLMSFVT